MQSLTIEQILEGVSGTLLCGDKQARVNSVSTDSRTVSGGTLFIPLKGERFDAHDFIQTAVKNGASAVLTHKRIHEIPGVSVILVKDTKRALAELAKFYKQLYSVPTVAVLGSVGKTTTKDMVAGVLSQQYHTLKTQGNYNNEIGLPLTIFGLEAEHEAAVLEMGMSGFGEIEKLADIGRPDIAVMTNIGVSHIEKLGSRENIFKAKMEVTKLFTEKNTLVANADDDFLSAVRGMGPYRVLYYGISNPQCDIKAENIQDHGLDGIDFVISYQGEKYPVAVPVAGVHNVYNALAAFGAGILFGIAPEKILAGIRSFELTKMRMSVEEFDGITVINDCYNAAPDSVKAAVKVLAASGREKRKIAVLGDVLEMGEFAKEAHLSMGKAAANAGIDVLIAAGKNSGYTAQAAAEGDLAVYWFETTQEAAEFAVNFVKPGDSVLIKASRGMHFEAIYQALKDGPKKPAPVSRELT